MYRFLSSYRASATVVKDSSKELLDYIYSGTEFNLELSVKETRLYGTTISIRRLCTLYADYVKYLTLYVKVSPYRYIHYLREIRGCGERIYIEQVESKEIVIALERSGVTDILLFSIYEKWWESVSDEHCSKLVLIEQSILNFANKILYGIEKARRHRPHSYINDCVESFMRKFKTNNPSFLSALRSNFLNNESKWSSMIQYHSCAKDIINSITMILMKS